MSRLTFRTFWFVLGALALTLGAIGAVLPLLPSTPFVILAAFAFGKSSPPLQARLERSRGFGPMIADWRRNGAIAPRYKAIALGMMFCALALGLASGLPVIAKIAQGVIMVAAATYVLSRPNPVGAPWHSE